MNNGVENNRVDIFFLLNQLDSNLFSKYFYTNVKSQYTQLPGFNSKTQISQRIKSTFVTFIHILKFLCKYLNKLKLSSAKF